MKMLFMVLVLCFLLLPAAFADTDNFFSVKSNTGPYALLPGEDVIVGFVISNKDHVYPRNVTAYLDPCPVGWACEQQTFSFADTGLHAVNLTVKVPVTAQPKKYTMYILLKSEWMTRRGDDRIVFSVMTDKDAAAVSYSDYSDREKALAAAEPPAERAPEQPEPDVPSYQDEAGAEEAVPSVEPEPETGIKSLVPDINSSEIVENVERLESSHQFVEYASVVLIVVLVFIAAGAIITFRKEK
ncbi:hypothetical protein JW898_00640 [Candidatus Woesearchaeota archaeon]|nr:hypothetical protein [Candidatus Woesearchaeota archaeon]